MKLSDDTLDVYAALVGAGDAARWALGDQLEEDAPKWESAAALYREVSRVGEKITTLRGCHWLSVHIPPVLRERYPLTRSQFRACPAHGVDAEDMEDRLDRTEEMCIWAIDHNMATVQAIETEVKRRKLTAQVEGKRALHPEWVLPRSEMSARLRACEVLLNGEMNAGLVALVRVLGL